MEDLPHIKETKHETVNFDKLAFDIITGRSEEDIAEQLSKEGVDEPYEKIAWFTKGLLCSRNLLLKKDSKWYSKAAGNLADKLPGNEKLHGMVIIGVVKEMVLCFLGFTVSLGMICIPAEYFTSRFGIILRPIVQFFGGFLMILFISYFIWALQMYWRSK